MKPTENDTHRYNDFGQPIGFALPGWEPPPSPPRVPLAGRYVRLEPFDAARHARQVYDANLADARGERWTYSFHGPYSDFGAYEAWARDAQASRDPQFYALVEAASGLASGTAAYMRIEPKHGVIELGNIYFAPRLAQTRAATEAI